MATESEETTEASFNWREYLDAIRKRWWIALLGMTVGAGAALFLLSRQEATYEARAVLFLAEEQTRVLDNMKPVVDGQFRNVDMINTMVDGLISYPFALRVVERLKLNTDRDFLSSAGLDDGSLSVERTARLLNGMVKARYREGTRLLDIFVTTGNPRESRILANSYAKEYLTYLGERRAEATKSADESLIAEAARLRAKMRKSEQAMQSFREKERTASLETMQEEAQTKLNETTARAGKLEERALQIRRDLAAAKVRTNSPEDLLRLPSVANEPRVAELSESISEQQRDIGLLSQRYRAKHPAFIAARTNLQFSIAERESILKSMINILETTGKQTDAQRQQTEATRESYEKELLAVTAKSVDYNDLKRELESDSAMYAAVLDRLKEVDITKGFSDLPVQIHQLAEEPAMKSASFAKILGLGVVGGLLAGMGIAVGLHLLDQSVKSVEEVEKISGLSKVSTVPIVKGNTDLVAFNARKGEAAEAFRSLRAAQTSLSNGSKERRVFLFTSSIPNEGKTFSSSNFAVTLAQQNLRTLLIDADLRKPTLGRLFSTKNREVGLTDLLAGKTAFEQALSSTEVPNLTLLTAGHLVDNPSELLSTAAFGELLAKALLTFDRVVIDSAPCVAVSDTFLVLPHVDACCLVVRAFSTPKLLLKRVIKSLSEPKYPKAHLILNCLPGRHAGAYY